MTKLFLTGLAVFLFSFSYGQENLFRQFGREATEKEQKIAKESNDCAKKTSQSLSLRLKNYPFNSSTKIQLVSFKSTGETTAYGFEYYKDSLPRLNDTVCYSRLNEVKNLTFLQVDKLTDILYNYGYTFILKPKKGVYYIGSMSQCYNPRNAILFLDKNNNAFEFIEICFECDKTKVSSDKINFGIMCNEKLEMLKTFFKKSGIEYGTM